MATLEVYDPLKRTQNLPNPPFLMKDLQHFKGVSLSEITKWCSSMNLKTSIFHYSTNYGSLKRKTRWKLQSTWQLPSLLWVDMRTSRIPATSLKGPLQYFTTTHRKTDLIGEITNNGFPRIQKVTFARIFFSESKTKLLLLGNYVIYSFGPYLTTFEVVVLKKDTNFNESKLALQMIIHTFACRCKTRVILKIWYRLAWCAVVRKMSISWRMFQIDTVQSLSYQR